MTFIAAMDNSGGSAGGVLDTYGQEWTEEDISESSCNVAQCFRQNRKTRNS